VFDAAQWRKRAEEMRDLIERVNDAKAREVMLKFAEAYENLAKHAEEPAERLAKQRRDAPEGS
jgi:hypothetical protein